MAPFPARSRILLTAVAAAVLLAGGLAVLAIVRLTDEPRPRAAPETIAAPPVAGPLPGQGPASPEPTEPPPARPAVAAAPPEAQPPAPAPAAPPEEPPADPPHQATAEPTPWESVAVETREAAPGPVAAALGRGLGALQPALAECRGEEAARGPAGPPQEDERGRTGLLAAVLHLHVETLADQLRIADAVVEDQGDAGDELVACAQRVLRGHVVAAPGVQAGQRYRVLHALSR